MVTVMDSLIWMTTGKCLVEVREIMEHKEIIGKRVILREQREEDAKFFAHWFNQPKVMFQCGFERPTNEEEFIDKNKIKVII